VTPLFLAVGVVSTIFFLFIVMDKDFDPHIEKMIVAILFFWFWFDVLGRMWLGVFQ
jgi:hypothetical protein